jgi:hypothetical protein
MNLIKCHLLMRIVDPIQWILNLCLAFSGNIWSQGQPNEIIFAKEEDFEVHHNEVIFSDQSWSLKDI